MTKRLWVIGFTVALSIGSTAFAADNLIPGKIAVVKPGNLAKFVSKGVFPLPAAFGAEDPTLNGAAISIFDDSLAAGIFLHNLPAVGWTGLGNPPGAKGYKYKGSVAGDLLCKIVLIKENVIKAVCKGPVTLFPPFGGDAAVILGVPVAQAGAAIRYCAEFGGTEKKNDSGGFKAKDAPAPPGCPETPF